MKKIERIRGKIYLVTEINAANCDTKKGIYEEFSKAFSFPENLGKSLLSIVDDYMTDLSWLNEKNYKLIVTNIKKFEKKYDFEDSLLKDILRNIELFWKEKKEREKDPYHNEFIIEYE